MLDLGIPFLVLITSAGASYGNVSRGPGSGSGIAALVLLGYIVWSLVLFVNGSSPGKALLGMYVVRENGRNAGFFIMLIREWLGKPLSGMLFSLGFLWILLDRDRQGWHDKLVSTYVVVKQ